MLSLWLLCVTALVIGTCALFVAFHSSGRALHKRLSELSQRCSDLEAAQESVQGRLKSFSLRISNQSRLKSPSPEDSESDTPKTEAAKDEWQRRMNLKIARGEVSALPRRR